MWGLWGSEAVWWVVGGSSGWIESNAKLVSLSQSFGAYIIISNSDWSPTTDHRPPIGIATIL